MGIAHRLVLTQTPEQAIAFFRRDRTFSMTSTRKAALP